ncbi:plasminogen-binding N-terminal domain-containing protein [Sulfurimonas sp.]|uniref:plasminogen-binding N-terminal domain-containing protein n=1 Tax=Sulfurimonas sp. TaxID=2022749 RepID=UPI0035647976
MKYIFTLMFLLSSIYGSVLKSTIASVDHENDTATMKVEKIDVGMSGFVVHKLDKDHSSIVKSAVVESFKDSVAVLKLSDFEDLSNTALPSGKWIIKEGDTVIMAFGYKRALLIAPTSEIYNKITKSASDIQWLHPDIFATILSINGHPTPLKEDFDHMTSSSYIGLIFIYLDSKLYTLDAKSFKILHTSDVSLEQKKDMLPFYSRVEEIDANWFGEGSDELEDYEPHYYELLIEYNPEDETLKKAYEAYEENNKETEE